MPITEVVFPVFKTDPVTAEILRTQEYKMFETIKGVPGMLHALRGPLVEANGEAVDPSTQRRALALEWDNAESFHAFSPDSEAFKGFFNFTAPLVAEMPVTQLFEAKNRSADCLSSSFTQVIKGKTTSETQERLEKIRDLVGANIPTYHGLGIEKDEDEFVALIGWKSIEEYEKLGKQKEVLDLVKQLNADNFLVPLLKVDI